MASPHFSTVFGQGEKIVFGQGEKIDYRFISNIQRKEVMHLRVHGRGTPGGYPVPRSPVHGIACGHCLRARGAGGEQGGTPGGYPGWLCTVALLLVLFSALLVVIAGPSSVQAHNAVRIETPTATPDANQILN